MPNPGPLADRLAALPQLRDIPRAEFEWLAANGRLESYPAGTVVVPKGKPVDHLYILLSGQVTVSVERGGVLRRVVERNAGDVTGLLPYSRMTGAPGDALVEADTEMLAVHARDLRELVAE